MDQSHQEYFDILWY